VSVAACGGADRRPHPGGVRERCGLHHSVGGGRNPVPPSLKRNAKALGTTPTIEPVMDEGLRIKAGFGCSSRYANTGPQN